MSALYQTPAAGNPDLSLRRYGTIDNGTRRTSNF